MMDRRGFLTTGLALLTAPLAAAAQPAGKVYRIGYLSFFPPNPLDDAFRQGLRDFGYIEGRNLTIEYRSAERKLERVQELANELVRLKVDIIVTTTGTSTLVVKKVTSAIPIVMAASGDAVRQGLVASLARPGGNVTGLTAISPELSGKRLELLREALPGVSRVAFLWCPGDPVNEQSLRETQVAARALGLQLQSVEAREPADLQAAFEAAARERAEALVVSDCPHRLPSKQTADLALQRRLPTMFPFRQQVVDAGGLMAYSPNSRDQFRRAAAYVDKILKGAKPADLPVDQPTRFELVINMKTAKALGLTIPPSVLVRADSIIE